MVYRARFAFAHAFVVQNGVLNNQFQNDGFGYLGGILRIKQSVKVEREVYVEFAYQRFVAAGEDYVGIEFFGRIESEHSEDDLQKIGNTEVTVLKVERQRKVRARRNGDLRKICVCRAFFRAYQRRYRACYAVVGNDGVYVFDARLYGLSEDPDDEIESRVVGFIYRIAVFVHRYFARNGIVGNILVRRGIQMDAYFVFGIGGHSH